MLDGVEAIHLVSTGFGQLIEVIGFPATFFLSSFFFLILVRICIAFVFKLFRLNMSYRALHDREKYLNARDQVRGL